jgi:outer membrane immunogenic protein
MMWTGLYFGGNVGYSWGNSATTYRFVDTTTGALLGAATSKANLDGAIGGIQFGYNWQSATWVYGVETDFQGSGQSGSAPGACAGGSLAGVAPFSGACTSGHQGDTVANNRAALPVNSVLSQKLDWFGTLRGRFGYTITPTLIGYATGGLAYGHVSSTDVVSGTNITGPQGTNTFTLTPVAGAFSNSATKAGWTLGTGLEGVVSGNWTAKIEYLYIDLGDVSGSFVTPLTTTAGNPLTATFRSHITDNILRVGFNYKSGVLPH